MSKHEFYNPEGLRCPNIDCDSADLYIKARRYVTVFLSEDNEYIDDDGDVEWDDDDYAGCQICGWTGTVAQLIKEAA